MYSPLRRMAALCLVLTGCIGLLLSMSLSDLHEAELFLGIAAILGVLLWLTRKGANGR